MDDDRARRLAAIEARLNPAPAATDSPGSGSSGTSSPAPAARGPLFGAPRPAQPTGWVRPSPKAEAERRRELARILNRTVVRDNSYADAAGCVETLLTIATNIHNSSDPKYRSIKGDNGLLKRKVMGVIGGRDFMILMGFRVETREFVQYFVLDQTQRRSYELELASGVLKDALPDLQKRVNERNASKQNYKADEAARVAAAKRQIHEDRELVRDRTERERIGREARVAVELEAEAAGVGAHAHEHGHDYEHGHRDDHDEDDYHGHDSDEEIADVHIHGLSNNWGQGRRLDEEVKDE